MANSCGEPVKALKVINAVVFQIGKRRMLEQILASFSRVKVGCHGHTFSRLILTLKKAVVGSTRHQTSNSK